MQLVVPSLTYKEAYLDALEETKEETSETKLNRPTEDQSFEEFIQMFQDHEKGIGLEEKYVPYSTFWLIDNGEVIGRVQIRHKLNAALLKRSGNIGYYTKPSKRKMGYGKKILELALFEAKKIGLNKALITCDETNIGSRKIIESNGGIFENKIETIKGNPKTLRFWITLS